MAKIVTFKCKPTRKTFGANDSDYKIYTCSLTGGDAKLNSSGYISIKGNIHELPIGVEHKVTGQEVSDSRYGYSYIIKSIEREIPNDEESTRLFLNEILVPSQVDVLMDVYPDIVDRVMEDRLEDVDLNKLKGIKEYRFNVIKEKIIENFAISRAIIEFGNLIDFNTLKKLYKEYKSTRMIKIKLSQEPYEALCRLSRVGFKTADGIMLELEKRCIEMESEGKEPPLKFTEDLRSSKGRMRSAIEHVLSDNELNHQNTKMALSDLKKESNLLVKECMNHFVQCIKDSMDILHIDSEGFISRKSVYEKAVYVTGKILNALDNPIVWNIDPEPYRIVDGCESTDEQFSLLTEIQKNSILIFRGSGGCVDADTEYFNGTEWVRIADYKQGDKVLQFNKDRTAELVKPVKYHKYKEENMFKLTNKGGTVDQVLSAEHNVLYQTSKGNLAKKQLFDVINMHNSNDFGFTGKFLNSFEYRGGDGISLSNEMIRVMIAVYADGSYYKEAKPENDSYYRCRFHIKKDRKKNRLRKLFSDAKIEWREKESSAEGYTDFYIDTCGTRNKQYPKEWYNATKEQLEIIYDEFLHWDGSIDKNGGRRTWSTTIKSDADFIQFVCSSLGYVTTILKRDRTGQDYETSGKVYKRVSVEYEVHIAKRKNRMTMIRARDKEDKIDILPYNKHDGYKYCFTVPSSMLVLRRNNRIFITGNTGKSHTTNTLVKMLLDNDMSVTQMTPTGRASKVLQTYTHHPASTIHRGLGYSGTWGLNHFNNILSNVVIIDETSMADLDLFYRLISAIDFSHTKLILVGDPDQLPSVGAGNVYHDLIQSNIIPTIVLTKVFRYGIGGISTVCTDIRLGKEYIDKDTKSPITVGGDKGFMFLPSSKQSTVKTTLVLYKSLLKKGYKPEDILVLSSQNVGAYGTIALNKELQKLANSDNMKSDLYIESTEKNNSTRYYVNDLIIQTSNNYNGKRFYGFEKYNDFDDDVSKIFIPNGDIGKVKDIHEWKTKCALSFDDDVLYQKQDLNNCLLGYSISAHKSQGGQAKVVIAVTPRAHIHMLNRNILYVMMSRAQEKLFQIGEPSSLAEILRKKENWNRKTNLPTLLKPSNKQKILDMYNQIVANMEEAEKLKKMKWSIEKEQQEDDRLSENRNIADEIGKLSSFILKDEDNEWDDIPF